MFGREEDCYLNLASLNLLNWNHTLENRLGCNGTYDEIMCWESVPGNTTIKKQCPHLPGVFDSTSNSLSFKSVAKNFNIENFEF